MGNVVVRQVFDSEIWPEKCLQALWSPSFHRGHPFKRNLDTFNFELEIFAKLKVSRVFALELKLSKTLRGLVYFVL